jgi:hypothetical protein
MNLLGYLVIYGWIPAVLCIFSTLRPRRAVVVALIAAWLFLPVVEFQLPGLPNYTKMSATTVGLLLGSALFDPGRLAALRPRWFDVPILTWCLVPMASSLTNGLGPYDGLSMSLQQTINWGLPYLLGRAYFQALDDLRELALGIVIGGLLYVPLCLFEIRMSPQLNRMIYGFITPWITAKRYGGWRPGVFLSNGLEVGMWMAASSLAGYWLWACGTLRSLSSWPVGPMIALLLVTAVLCKSTGALLLMIVGIAILWVAARTGWSLPVWVLVLAPPLYMATRASGVWDGRVLLDWTRQLTGDEDRVGSLWTRLYNENMLTLKALQRPVFGWGGWGRARVHNEAGDDVSITDGLWIIALGNHGVVGLAGVTATLLLPAALLLVRHPVRSWREPGVAPAAALAVLVALYMFDNLSNDMRNPIYLTVAGAVLGATSRRGVRIADSAHDPDGRPSAAAGGLTERNDRAHRTHECDAIARSLRITEPARAVAAWVCALEGWAGLATDSPDEPEYRRHWLDGLNDLAWFLATDSPPSVRDPLRAVRLATEAVAGAPDRGAYWNTLGVALYHTGDWDAAIQAIERSIALSSGGMGPDFLVLALVHGRRGDHTRARSWFLRAESRLRESPAEATGCELLRREVLDLLQ